MLIGYTLFDPVFVLAGTAYAILLLSKNSEKLFVFLPLAFSLYFILPAVGYLTLSRTIPLLLIVRLIILGRFHTSPTVNNFLVPLVLILAASFLIAPVLGADQTRVFVRFLYYVGMIALFLFCFEIGSRPGSDALLVKGFAMSAVVLTAYGGYQIVAHYTGLPFRGIVYGPNSSGYFAEMFGLPRVNSLANEPKRLGFVLFVGALACFKMAREIPRKRMRWTAWGWSALLVSLLTFSSSYFLTLVLFVPCLFLLYRPKLRPSIIFAGIIILAGLAIGPGMKIVEVLGETYERRMAEISLGLDGKVVYRQEFYAEEYLKRHPIQIISGVGVGRYYQVLNKEFGHGVGYSENGGLAPLNSNVFEAVFDLGGIGAVLLYAGIFAVLVRLRLKGFDFLFLSLLFLALHSLTILTLPYMVLASGFSVGQLHQRSRERGLHAVSV